MTSNDDNTTATGDFAKRVGQSVNGCMELILALMGDRLGLFKDLATRGAGSVEELAKRNNVNERYLLEWLNGMVSAKYLAYDPNTKIYSIPPENIPVLAQDYGPTSMGGMISMVGSALPALPRVLESFSKGGGVAYSEYPPTLWDGLERHTGCKFENDLLGEWMNGLDPSVRERLEAGVRACDVGCGRGRALRKLAKAFPKTTFVGYDVYPPTVESAQAKAKEEGLDNLSFSLIRTKESRLPGELYDIIFVFDVIHDSADPLALLTCIRASLKPNGILACLDIRCSDHASENPTFAYGVSMLYCMTTSLQQGGVGLGTCGLTEKVMRDLCEKAGFHSVRRVEINSPFNILWEARVSPHKL